MSSALAASGSQHIYSFLKLFTGLATAALIAWALIVINAITRAINAAAKNIHHPMLTRYTKSCSHLFMVHQANGKAMTAEIAISFTKSFESIPTMPETEAPSTLRMQFFFVRFS